MPLMKQGLFYALNKKTQTHNPPPTQSPWYFKTNKKTRPYLFDMAVLIRLATIILTALRVYHGVLCPAGLSLQ
jgi:hypothetical protein